MGKDSSKEWWRVPSSVLIAGGVGITAALWWRVARREEEGGAENAHRDRSLMDVVVRSMQSLVATDSDNHQRGKYAAEGNGNGELEEVDALRSRVLALTARKEELEHKMQSLEEALQLSHSQNQGLREAVDELQWQLRSSKAGAGPEDVRNARDAHLVLMAQRAAACERGEISHEVLPMRPPTRCSTCRSTQRSAGTHLHTLHTLAHATPRSSTNAERATCAGAGQDDDHLGVPAPPR
jgi:hypothetical protein